MELPEMTPDDDKCRICGKTPCPYRNTSDAVGMYEHLDELLHNLAPQSGELADRVIESLAHESGFPMSTFAPLLRSFLVGDRDPTREEEAALDAIFSTYPIDEDVIEVAEGVV